MREGRTVGFTSADVMTGVGNPDVRSSLRSKMGEAFGFQQPQTQLKVIDALMSLAHDEDDAIVDSVLVAVSNMASSSQGFIFLSHERNFLNLVLNEIIPFSRGDLKISSLRAISCFLSQYVPIININLIM